MLAAISISFRLRGVAVSLHAAYNDEAIKAGIDLPLTKPFVEGLSIYISGFFYHCF